MTEGTIVNEKNQVTQKKEKYIEIQTDKNIERKPKLQEY